MLKILLLSYMFFLAVSSMGGDFHRKIIWSDQMDTVQSSGKIPLRFEGSISNGENEIPYWFESFELNSNQAEVNIENAVFESIQDSLVNKFIIDQSELQYDCKIGSSAGKSFLHLTINPFVKRNNRIERLVKFTISINENPNQLKSAQSAFEWKTASILASGKWTKIKTVDKGIYKITYDQLKDWGYVNPEQVCLYGNGGYMLPLMNRELKVDDLLPYPVWKGKDNNNKDCLFFYSTGNIRLNYNIENGSLSHQQNYYSTETYYYLADKGDPLIIKKAPEIIESAGRQVTTFPNYIFYEKELTNLIGSGSQWYGEQFNMGATKSVNISVDNPDITKQAIITISAAGRSVTASDMDVIMNGKLLLNLPFSGYSDYEYGRKAVKNASSTLTGKNIQFKLTYNGTNSVSAAWLDYIGINYQSFLNMNADVYNFRGRGVDGAILVSEFILTGSTTGTKVLNVTNFQQVIEMPADFADGQLKFKSNSSLMNEYVAFNPTGNIPVPEMVGEIGNQNLHGADVPEMIIVTNSKLISAANELAEFHRDNDQMTVHVITPDLIYNEFAGGLPDPAGIRNYFRMHYDRGKASGMSTLKYVLLFGDGSYDNRNILGNGMNLLPTYQSENSLVETQSFVTDDFFAFLDENEGGTGGIIDLGIGRIPANTLPDAETVVDKVKSYYKKETMGNWRNIVTFIADDGNIADGYTNLHLEQAEDLAVYVNKNYPAFFEDKIYLDTYRPVLAAAGVKYPDVNEAINERVKRGTLIMNYTGHGNEKGLADESIIDISGIKSWSNYNRLPIFVTATCSFSRFDDNETSAGETILFNPLGGGVGLFSTTRLVYSGENFILNSKFFKYIFQKDREGNNLRLGDVMRLAKAEANTGTNQLNFTLLADPALRLANPNNQIVTTSINGNDVNMKTDTINTLSVVTVKGYVANSQGNKLTSFNGEIIPTVYDKAMQLETLGNAGQETTSFSSQNNIIYKGLANVVNGEFEFSFFVPKEVSYKVGKGKILYYAYNELVDASGYFDNFYLGGSINSYIDDTNGPEIDLYMNSESFKEGGTVSANSILIANVKDNIGINTSGIGIGHDITAILDGDNSNLLILNDFFQSDKNNYTGGKIIFPLSGLSEGEHLLKIKVWDVFNNSSEKEIRFVVKDDFRIETVSSYPNPMQGKTQIVFTHNQPDEIFNVELEVFQIDGSRLDLLSGKIGSQGIESLPLNWIPAERKVKMKPGVYIYRINVTTKDDKKSSASGRFIFQY